MLIDACRFLLSTIFLKKKDKEVFSNVYRTERDRSRAFCSVIF